MNSEKSSQQEPEEQVHVLILLRSSAPHADSQEEFDNSIQEFTFAICNNKEKFLEYASYYEQLDDESGTTVVGGFTMTPMRLSGFATNKGNMFVQGVLVGLVELIQKSQSQDKIVVTKDLSIN